VFVGVTDGVPVGVSVFVGVGVGVSVDVDVGVGVGAASITIVNVLAFAPEPQLQVYVPGVKFIPAIVVPAYVVEPLMSEPDVYPVGTNKFLFVPFDNIPKVSPEPDIVPRVPPSVPKLVGNVVTPLNISRVGIGSAAIPIPQTACDAWNPALNG
jgi:hypothetical protein